MKAAHPRHITRWDVSPTPPSPLPKELTPESRAQSSGDVCGMLTSPPMLSHGDQKNPQPRCALAHETTADIDNHGHPGRTMTKRLLQLLRFCAVGLTCLALSVTILAALHEFAGVNYLLAYVVTFIVANIVGYVLNARFTFSAHSMSHSGAIRYMLINATLLCINTAALGFLVGRLHLWYMTAAILLAGINSPTSFVAQRFVTYHSTVQNRSRDT
jgi:putative flippase GtrA